MKSIRILIPLLFGITQIGECQWIVYNPYNTKGIEGTMISSGFVAKNDKIWFGTDQGVACYDSEYSLWTNYNTHNYLTNNFVYQVFEDKAGNIWVATNGGGVSKYSGDTWINFTINDGLSYNVVRAISQSPDGTMWFGTYGHGICSYRPETGFKKYTSGAIAGSYVLSLLALSDKIILTGTLNEGLIIMENDTVRALQNGNDLVGKKVFSIFRDHNDKTWIGTDKGVQQVDLLTRTVLTCPDSLLGKPVYAISENPENELVFASVNKIYTLRNGSWSSFAPDNLPNSTTFYSAFYDKKGNGWFGSSNQGLFRKTGAAWYNYFNSSGLNTNYLNDMCEDKDHNLWFTSYGDIYRFDGQNWNNVTQKAGIRDNYGKILADLKGNIWCTTYSGLYKYDGTTWKRYSSAEYFNNGYIGSLILDKEGSLWAGVSYQGVYRYDGTNWTRFTTEQGLATDNIRTMALYPDGRLAVVSEYAQISIFDGTSWSTDLALTGNQYIYDMVIDADNTIWLATYNGIIRYKDTQTVSYFVNDSYGNNYVTFISIDLNGQIWAGLSNTGLVVYNGSNWSTYNTSNGLSSNYLTDILFDSRERIWVLADNGINMSASFTNIDEPGPIPSGKGTVYPNPFSGFFDIQYSSKTAGFADIHFYSADGRIIKQYNQQAVDPGDNTFHFESDNWPDGILICKIIMAGSSENIKLLKVSTH